MSRQPDTKALPIAYTMSEADHDLRRGLPPYGSVSLSETLMLPSKGI